MPAKKGSYPLHMATWNGDHVEVVEQLLRAGAKWEVHNRNGQTPLEQARWFDKMERESLASHAYELEEWRSRFGRLAPGRERMIAALTAVEAKAKGEEGEAKEDEEDDDGEMKVEEEKEKDGAEAGEATGEAGQGGKEEGGASEEAQMMAEMEAEDAEEAD